MAAKLYDQDDVMFAWEHLKDHIDLCTVFISGREISITPAVVPVRTLSYFDTPVRRIYLSATLAAKESFVRAFGTIPNPIIAPSITAGKCERLILAPALNPKCIDDVKFAKQTVKDQKAIILIPSMRRAQQHWAEYLSKTDAESVSNVARQIDIFKKSRAADKLPLIARYDGVDLPGDTCRVMIIDDLPVGVGPLERYLWEKLGLEKTLRSIIASRIVQSFGRISRGMSDHGVVILTGKSLIDWILTPINRQSLPDFLRHQLELGISISQQADQLQDLADSVDQCLRRDRNWLEFYRMYMDELEASSPVSDEEETLAIARCEAKFGHELWLRDYSLAAQSLKSELDNTFATTQRTGAWHALWLGYCYELLGDSEAARQMYDRAHKASKSQIPPVDLETSLKQRNYPWQIVEASKVLKAHHPFDKQSLAKIDQVLTPLSSAKASTNQVEEALRTLGEYLGLDSSRPENELGTGPDVLWDIVGGPALSMECKTGKSTSEHYRKKDELGQLPDHLRWVQRHTSSQPVLSALVGPILPASPEANPDPDTLVIELSEFRELGARLRAAIADIFDQATPPLLQDIVARVFKERNLLWPSLLEDLHKQKLIEIRPKH